MPPKGKRKAKDEDEDYVMGVDDFDDHDALPGDFDDEMMPGEAGSKRRGGGRGSVAGGRRGKASSAASSSFLSAIAPPLTSFEEGECHDYSKILTLKKDHEKRPIWITEDCIIILEAFSPYYKNAYDFLIDIAEPESRPEFVHTYRLTKDSLYAAVAIARTSESIIKQLNIFCKVNAYSCFIIISRLSFSHIYIFPLSAYPCVSTPPLPPDSSAPISNQLHQRMHSNFWKGQTRLKGQ